jgi:uncharacterized membrane protein
MTPSMESVAPKSTRLDTAVLAALCSFTALAIAGYATFGRHPELLGRSPSAVAIYSVAFTLFARAHVVLAFVAFAIVLTSRTQARWLATFAVIYIVTLLTELAGTTIGLPFGPYRYTDGLGLKWFGHVPALIPASWFFMAVPSYLLARRQSALADRSRPGIIMRAVLLGSFTLLAWDLALDPAMSWATKYWVWGSNGPYYGMPLLNLLGWYVTGLALMLVLAAFRFERLAERVPTRWLGGFYLANLALPLGLIAAHGALGAIGVSSAAVALSLLGPAVLRNRRRALALSATPPAMRELV